MGQRNLDRIHIAQWRSKYETVEAMHRDRIDVVSKCRKCDLTMQVDLALVIKVSGPNVSLWNRKARCRRLLCDGWVDFHAKAPGVNWYAKLAAPE